MMVASTYAARTVVSHQAVVLPDKEIDTPVGFEGV
jgi:hypothetical protein